MFLFIVREYYIIGAEESCVLFMSGSGLRESKIKKGVSDFTHGTGKWKSMTKEQHAEYIIKNLNDPKPGACRDRLYRAANINAILGM